MAGGSGSNRRGGIEDATGFSSVRQRRQERGGSGSRRKSMADDDGIDEISQRVRVASAGVESLA